MVDARRIGFYGLSYGGETAVRVPTILEGYCLSICSGDFNTWNEKVAATDQRFSFMYTIEWEMPYFNMGSTFDYAEMTYLMMPRPFMVERGHNDRVGRDQWVAYQYAKVRWLYAQLGLADRTEIEFFNGGHTINGEGTFRVLAQAPGAGVARPLPVRPAPEVQNRDGRAPCVKPNMAIIESTASRPRGSWCRASTAPAACS